MPVHENSRKIIHIDMDAFFASVEQRDNPELRGKPIVVGGRPDSRGVVAAASYEARVFGIRSAMSSAQAYRRCPDAIFVKPRLDIYRRISRVIMAVLRDYTDLVEPLSLDEAYMDVTRNKKGLRYAAKIAAEARSRIFEYTGLTASAGVAPNKFLAKIASDINKPNGLKVIPPDQVEKFLLPLPVRKIPGVGKVTEERMAGLGIFSVSDLRFKGEEYLKRHFGKTGSWYHQLSFGIDERAVEPLRERKSIGAEDTFEQDIQDLGTMYEKIDQHAARVSASLKKRNFMCRTVTLKIKYGNFEIATRSKTMTEPICDTQTIAEYARGLLSSTDAAKRAIRLIGVSVSNLSEQEQHRSETPIERQIALSF